MYSDSSPEFCAAITVGGVNMQVKRAVRMHAFSRIVRKRQLGAFTRFTVQILDPCNGLVSNEHEGRGMKTRFRFVGLLFCTLSRLLNRRCGSSCDLASFSWLRIAIADPQTALVGPRARFVRVLFSFATMRFIARSLARTIQKI